MTPPPPPPPHHLNVPARSPEKGANYTVETQLMTAERKFYTLLP